MKRQALFLVAAFTMLAALSQNTEPIRIQYNGTSANVTVPDDINDVTYTVNGANVTINSGTLSTEYTYQVSGTSADGSLLLNGSYKLTLQLAGIDLTNQHGGAAIDIECGKRIAVELVEGTVNRLADAQTGGQKGALYFKGHPEFEGKGTLYVTGNAKHAIAAKEYIELKKSTGTINILGAVSDGIHCGKGQPNSEHNCFLMKGGIVNITHVGSDGVDSDDFGVIKIEGGALSVNVDGDDATGLKADSCIVITDGAVSVAVKGRDSEGLNAHYATRIEGGKLYIAVTGDGSKGIKGKQETASTETVLNGGFVTITGGVTDIQVTGGNYTTTVDGTEDVSKCMGLSVDADFTQTGGKLSITALGKEAYVYNVKGTETISGGTFEMTRTPWTMDIRNYEKDMTAFVAVMSNGVVVEDYSSLAIGAFTGNECVGYATFSKDPEGYGIMRIHSNASADGDDISFRLYDYNNDSEFELTPSQDVTFASNTYVGNPDNPLLLYYSGNILMGDVNGDGEVDLSDAIMVTYYSLNVVPANFIEQAADMNGDGEIDLSDAIIIIYTSLGVYDGSQVNAMSPSLDLLMPSTKDKDLTLPLDNQE